MNGQVLDVSALEPCEPMQQTLAAIADMGPGDYLRVLHRREPHPLYPMLDKLGCAWNCRPGTSTAFEILIWRRADRAAGRAVEFALRQPPA